MTVVRAFRQLVLLWIENLLFQLSVHSQKRREIDPPVVTRNTRVHGSFQPPPEEPPRGGGAQGGSGSSLLNWIPNSVVQGFEQFTSGWGRHARFERRVTVPAYDGGLLYKPPVTHRVLSWWSPQKPPLLHRRVWWSPPKPPVTHLVWSWRSP